jgi:hypothetical protein
MHAHESAIYSAGQAFNFSHEKVNMQRLYWAVLLIAALATAAVGQMDDMKPKPKAKANAKMSASAATEQRLVDMEKSLWEAWKNHDSGTFQKLLSSESVNVNPMGFESTEQAVKEIGGSDCKVNRYSVEDPKTTWVDKDAVLLPTKPIRTRSVAGKKFRRLFGLVRSG